jgi:hypothetical protein
MHAIRKLTATTLTTLGVLGGLTLYSTPALAKLGYGAADPATTTPGLFTTPGFIAAGPGFGEFGGTGLGVDQTSHDVYVVSHEYIPASSTDGGGIAKFNEKGEPADFSSLGSNVFPIASGVSAIAVDNSSTSSQGDPYVAQRSSITTPSGEPSGRSNDATVYRLNASGQQVKNLALMALSAESDPAVAVDLSGNIYVATVAFGGGGPPFIEIEEFSSTGEPSRSNPVVSFQTVSGLAFNLSGDLYVSQPVSGAGTVEYAPSGGGFKKLRTIESAAATAVAVDRSTGNVYVDTGSAIEEFDASGNPAGGVSYAFGAEDLDGGSNALAVDEETKVVYALEQGGEETGEVVDVFRPGEAPVAPVAEGAQGEGFAVTLKGELRGGETGYYFAYNSDGSCGGGSTTPVLPATGNVKESVRITGLEPSTTYTLCVVAVNQYGPQAAAPVTFDTIRPLVSVGGTSGLTASTVTLNGVVNPSGIDDTKWCFQYGTDTGYTLGYAPGFEGDVGQGTSGMPVSATLSGLQQGRTYHYRLVAVDELGAGSGPSACGTQDGKNTYGPDRTFTTPLLAAPPVSTGAASAVTQSSATLSGSLDPQGLGTVYEFQFGVDTAYGVEIYGGTRLGSAAQAVTLTVQDLQPGTTYHYRLLARNLDGTSYGQDASFTTSVFPTSLLSAPATPVLVPTPPFTSPASPAGSRTREAVKKKAKRGRAKKRAKRKKGKRAKKSVSSRKKR